MKNLKRVLGLAVLMAIVASFAVSCSLSTHKNEMYYAFLDGIWETTNKGRDDVEAEISKDDIKKQVEGVNKSLAAISMKIEDTKASEKVAKGISYKDLQKRFKYKKA